LTEECWGALLDRVKRGATVAITGVIDQVDEPWLPVQQTESLAIGGRDYSVRFEGEKIQRIEKAGFTRTTQTTNQLGTLIRSPLPLELGDSMEALLAFYRMAMTRARVAPIFTATPKTPAVLVLPSVFREVVLYTFVSETNRDTRLQVTDRASRKRFSLTVPAGRTAMVIINRRTGAILP
jgi:hypothetical protein